MIVKTRYDPSFLLVSPGKLPEASDRLLMIGMKIPPALALVEGIAGAMMPSAIVRPYARPRVDLPIVFTKRLAMRSPKPHFSKPLAK